MRTMQEELGLQASIDALSKRILIAVIPIGHRAGNAMFGMQGLIGTRTISDAAVGVGSYAERHQRRAIVDRAGKFRGIAGIRVVDAALQSENYLA